MSLMNNPLNCLKQLDPFTAGENHVGFDNFSDLNKLKVIKSLIS